jgi:hypothetical protein
MSEAAVKCFASFLLFLSTLMDQSVAMNSTLPLDLCLLFSAVGRIYDIYQEHYHCRLLYIFCDP